MLTTNDTPGFFTEVGQNLRDIPSDLRTELHLVGAEFRNWQRRRRKARVDYVVWPIGGTLPERNGPPRGFIERRLPIGRPSPYTLEQLNAQVDAILDAENVGGVLLIFRGFSARLATLQNFRRSVERLRAGGKDVVVYTPYLSLGNYFAATAADAIIIPPSAQFEALGLFTEVVFLKDALARIGVQADVIQISPYKTALDQLGRSEMSDEQRQQLDWLLDDQFETAIQGMAQGRNLPLETIRELIDRAPHSAEAARAAGLVDAVAYDDELLPVLARRLKSAGAREMKEQTAGNGARDQQEQAAPQGPVLKSWREARSVMLEKVRRPTRKFIGVISLEGMIMMGPSRTPPVDLPIPFLGGEVAGEQTLVSLLRQTEKMPNLAALIFHVDSGGGSALASDLIGRQVEQVARRIPVVVYMGDIAASGGYYVAAQARHIMSQTATITGSIGVITARISTSALYEHLTVNRQTLKRGEHAGLYAEQKPLTAAERDIFERTIHQTYDQFKQVVSAGRKLPLDGLDEICLGRVWTGRQAAQHGLVDSHGDFVDAVRLAAELAGIEVDQSTERVAVSNLHPRGAGYVIPQTPKAGALEQLAELLSGEQLKTLSGRPLMLLPFEVRGI
jgi:protease-4